MSKKNLVILFIFLISNKIYIYIYIRKRSYPSIQEIYWCETINTVEKKERFLKVVSLSNKVRKKNNLRLGIECLVFSKLLLFLSL